MSYILFLLAVLLVQGTRVNSMKGRTSLATFNAALSPYFRSVGKAEIEERAGLLIKEIESSNVNIWCLQEIYYADIQRQIYKTLKDEYPYILTATDLSVDDSASIATACTVKESQNYLICVGEKCSGLQGPAFTVCSVFSCLYQVEFQPCRDCLAFFRFPYYCTTTLKASRFETNYGLMLLSQKKLQDTGMSGFNNQSQFRGYLQASVKGVGDIVCTHLSSFFPYYVGPPVVSPPLYSNYDVQQYDELMKLFEVLTSKDTPILMGDINSGPASPGNTWELPFHYGLINARGFVSPYVLEDGRCTFCSDNSAVELGGFQSDLLIDHIFLTTSAYKQRAVSSERILDSIRLESGNPLSDHYGVQLTLKNIQSNNEAHEPQMVPLPAPQAELKRLCVAY